MTYRAARTLAFTSLALLSSTSLASAGFIWLSPEDEPAAAATPYPAQAEPAVTAESTMPEQPLAAPAPVADAPVALTPATTDEPQSLAQAAEEVKTILDPNTVAAAPVYTKGDQAPVTLAPAPMAEPAPAQEVTLAKSSSTMVSPQPSALPGASAASAMPTAQSLIDGMPSMTAPRAASAPVVTTAPASAPAVSAVVASSTEPSAVTVDAEGVKSRVIETKTEIVTAPAAAPAPTNGAAVSPITGATLTRASAPVPAAETAQAQVQGFGKQVPLVVAMRQILPPGYSFVKGEGVDLSQSVDWQGGKAWPDVLADAVQPLGLTARLTGDTVVINRADAVTPVTAAKVPVLTNATMMQKPPAN